MPEKILVLYGDLNMFWHRERHRTWPATSLPFGGVTSSDIVLGQCNLTPFGSLLVQCFASSKHVNYSEMPTSEHGKVAISTVYRNSTAISTLSSAVTAQQQQVPHGPTAGGGHLAHWG